MVSLISSSLKPVHVALGGGAGDDSAVGKAGQAPHVLVADLAEHGESLLREGLGISDAGGVHAGLCELREVQGIDLARIPSCHEGNAVLVGNDVENRVGRQGDLARHLSPLHEVQAPVGRRACQNGAVRKREQGKHLGIIDTRHRP